MGRNRRPRGKPEPQDDAISREIEEPSSILSSGVKKMKKDDPDTEFTLLGDPLPTEEAIQKWPHHYKKENKGKNISNLGNANGKEYEEQAKFHYTRAKVDGNEYNLGDDVYVKAGEGEPHYIARILEFFESTEGVPHFTAQWFYRINDSVIKDSVQPKESKRVFLSEMTDDNHLDCIVSKVKIALVKPNMDLADKEKQIPADCELYYDMKYKLPFLTYETINADDSSSEIDSALTVSRESNSDIIGSTDCVDANIKTRECEKTKMYLLDLYSGCGAMSTGLCMGASLSGVELVTRWAVDFNSDACKSLKMNHPETEVRNETSSDFLSLLKEWKKLCIDFSLFGSEKHIEQPFEVENDEELVAEQDNDDNVNGSENSSEEFEVEKLVAVCYGDPNKSKKSGLHFKVRWKGYGPKHDTWEPIGNLSDCKERLKEFVTKGYRSNILPLPGNADIICGGPPCQGISGFNRFRNAKAPLDDPKNEQLVVFMDIVEYLKPKYVLMENVVDILRFANGFLARYALGRLISMNYQARMGIMAAGSYGVPQFRMRMFLWGAHPFKGLPQFPLPTHEAVPKSGFPNGFEEIAVAYDVIHPRQLEKPIVLGDALKDLPSVTNDESQDERNYGTTPETEFQKFIRLKRNDVLGYTSAPSKEGSKERLYDHLPLKLNTDDFQRVCHVPKKKGANFRDFPGVKVGPDNKVHLDESVERVVLPSGNYLVPNYALTYVEGKSKKPFGRLWWDEIVPTVVTRAEPHNQIIVHPEQDRVLTVRENARIQGFPDCYQLQGSIKEKYTQVGNAVAVPVALALGYSFGKACQGLYDGKPVSTLPFKYPNCLKKTEVPDAMDQVEIIS